MPNQKQTWALLSATATAEAPGPAPFPNTYSLDFDGVDGPSNPVRTSCRKADGTPCLDGWVGWRGECYLFVNKSVQFHAANQACIDLNTTLLSITSQEEMDFVKRTVRGRCANTS